MNELHIEPELCATSLDLRDRAAILDEIARRVAGVLKNLDAAEVRSGFERREKIGSTGLEKGIAIPHCALTGADRFVVGVITLATPIDYGAIDGKPSDIFLFIAGPEAQRNEHVRIMAAITAQLRRGELRDRIRAAGTGTELVAILREGVQADDKGESGRFTLVILHVQNDELFEPVLELVSGEPGSSVAVSEGQSAGAILNRMPLFATFWNESETREIHRVEVILPRDRVNRAIRRIEDLSASKGGGVQIAAMDLSYAAGHLEL